ncbi:GNAT family N-acetyltransferase [Paenibacillus wynnii]|uniref:GCN5 family acetyltransferase n=1 Tax=Paenibacillus wynnii TaxID=268407 RepID=A0A098MAP3_9BACL|nr:GNAT family N-acetyltransferase [Paenibacillus wynnii]KGE19615.1 GCN5 family acetyltransferase [Paenibacillus wynnii]
MELQIRKASNEDIKGLCRLMEQLNGRPLLPEEMERRLDFIDRSPTEELYVCTETTGEGKTSVLGALGFRLRENNEKGRYGEVSLLVTDRRVRRRGIGKSLIAYAEHLASERGCIGTWLASGMGRVREAHIFYESMGYQITGYRFVKNR